jgi:uncharacterized Zn finger protein
MKCRNCGNEMVHIETHKNDGVTRDNYKDTWKPETYLCDECGNIEYI